MRSAGLLAVLPIAGCTTSEEILASYEAPPATCEAIDEEMGVLASKVAELSTLETGRDGAAVLLLLAVAVEAINPAFALVQPLVGAIPLDSTRDEERLRFLATAKLHRSCP